ncbi:MAG TPA: hypothetical protein VEQ42_03620, partial [Pyrinomonadaceae bacterium]|nr:hypothetical protein [Pyrinomonadaceae bacterium]
RLFAERLAETRGFALAAPPEMAVVCFRALPESVGDGQDLDGHADELNRALVESVNATRRAYLTHTTLRGRVAARLAVGNVLTTERHVSQLLALLEEQAALLRPK